MPIPTSFEATWASMTSAKGWLTRGQAFVLWEEASRLRSEALVLEIGSYEGRSTVVLGSALRHSGGRVVAIDPFVSDWKFGDPRTRTRFEHHVDRAGLGSVVELVPDYSTAVRPHWTRPLDLLFIDGKHDFLTVRDDLKWVQHLPLEAPVLVHDAFSSVGVTTALLTGALTRRDLRYERRVGSLAIFRVGRPGAREHLRLLREMPWWARNLGIKVLLRLRQRTVLRVLRYTSPYDPY